MEPRANVNRPTDKLAQLNDPGESFKNPGQLEFVRQFVRTVRDALGKTIDRDQAAPHLHLTSPAGKVFKVTVRDDGSIGTQHIRG